jgi:cardiolipin synthase
VQGLPLHQIPNLLTLMRLLLSLPISLLLLSERFSPALLLFVVAGVSDALDGFLARRFAWTSRLGSMLDPLADKLLLVTAYVCLTLVQVLPCWLMLLVLLRDMLILFGATCYRLLVGRLEFRPTWLGKCSTVTQIVLVVAVLLELGVMPAFAVVREPLITLVAALTLASGTHYVWRWSRNYRLARQGA